MKILKYIPFFITAIFITVVLQSCGNENKITAPIADKVSDLNVPASHFDASKDTIIFLPQSKKWIEIDKKMPIQMIKSFDAYLISHKIVNSAPANNPKNKEKLEMLPCNNPWTVTTYSWELENQYEPVSGKNLGIWSSTNILPFNTAKNTYGFTMALVEPDYNTDPISFHYSDASKNGLFADGNIMMHIPDGNNVVTAKAAIIEHTGINWYFIDEPVEHDDYNNIQTIAAYIRTLNSPFKLLELSVLIPVES